MRSASARSDTGGRSGIEQPVVRSVAPSGVAPGSAVDSAPMASASRPRLRRLAAAVDALEGDQPAAPAHAVSGVPVGVAGLAPAAFDALPPCGLRGRGLLGRSSWPLRSSWPSLPPWSSWPPSCRLGRLLRGLGRPPGPLHRRPRGAAVGEQLGGALDGDRLGLVPLAQRRVRRPVGHVGPEATRAHDDRRGGLGVVAELPERRGRGPAPARLGLREERQRLVEGHGEQLLLGVEAAGVGALLHVGPEPAVEGLDLLTRRGVGADGPGQAQQLERLVEGDGLGRHRS